MGERTERIRRVVIGEDADGGSAVVSDGPTPAISTTANGAVVQEIWRQDRLPMRPGDDGTTPGWVDGAVPPEGAVVRNYTLPAGHTVDPIHCSPCAHVITVLCGEVRVVLEQGGTVVRASDTVVLPGHMHTLQNLTDGPASMIYVAFPLEQ